MLAAGAISRSFSTIATESWRLCDSGRGLLSIWRMFMRKVPSVSRKSFSVLDETRAITDALIKLNGVVVDFVCQLVHTKHPATFRVRIYMLDQCAADTTATRIVRNK